MTPERFSPIFSIGIILYAISMLCFRAKQKRQALMLFWRAYASTGNPTISPFRLIPPFTVPEVLKPSEAVLQSLQFTSIGAGEFNNPEIGPTQVHMYQSQTGLIVAFLFIYDDEVAAATEFSSYFTDKSMLSTTYPIGERVETSDVVANFARHSIEAAYAYHQQRLEAWLALGKEAIEFQNADDVATVMQKRDNRFSKLYRRRSHHLFGRMLLCSISGHVLCPLGLIAIALLNNFYLSLVAGIVYIIVIGNFEAHLKTLLSQVPSYPHAIDDPV